MQVGVASAVSSTEAVTAPVLAEIANITKRYKSRQGAVLALDGVSFDVREGEFVSLVGPSGCGKSTLLMLMAGLIPPTAGSITIQGKVVKDAITDVGIVFQRDVLLDWRNVLNNVMLQIEIRHLDRRPYRRRAEELLSMAGLDGFEHKYPWQLSGGMRQRVSICRALVHDPPLLLMDEPFGALDAITRDQMNLDVLRIWGANKKTVLFITHSISEAIFLSDRVLVMSMRPGRIVEEIEIDLPRPRRLRDRETTAFAAYATRIRTVFEANGVLRED